MADEDVGQNFEPYFASIIDRVFLFLNEIEAAYRLNSNCVIFYCRRGSERLVYLKFSYAGNVQYHKIRNRDFAAFREAFGLAEKMSDTRRER